MVFTKFGDNSQNRDVISMMNRQDSWKLWREISNEEILPSNQENLCILKVPHLPERNNKPMMHLVINGELMRKARKKRSGIKCRKIGTCGCMVLLQKKNLAVFKSKKSSSMQVVDLIQSSLVCQVGSRILGCWN